MASSRPTVPLTFWAPPTKLIRAKIARSRPRDSLPSHVAQRHPSGDVHLSRDRRTRRVADHVVIGHKPRVSLTLCGVLFSGIPRLENEWALRTVER